MVIRPRNIGEREIYPYLSRLEKMIREQRFAVRRADREDIKRILAVYFAGDVISESYSEVVIPENFSDETVKACKEYQITFVPEGYQKVFDTADEYGAIYGYFNDEEEFFTVTILQLDDPESQTIRFDTEDADFVQPININSSLGLMISKEGETQIVWQNSQM